jgi:hypothetical protein
MIIAARKAEELLAFLVILGLFRTLNTLSYSHLVFALGEIKGRILSGDINESWK